MKRTLRGRFAFGIAVLIVCGTAAWAPAEAPRILKAPVFELGGLEGNRVVSDDLLKGNKAVLVNFWATWCPSCREEIPKFIELRRAQKGNGLAVIGIDVNESEKKVSAYAAKLAIDYPVLLDSDSSVAERFGVSGLPTTYLIDSQGRVIGEYHGFTDELVNDVKKALKN